MIYLKIFWVVFCNILAFYVLINTIYVCFFSGAPAIPSSAKTLKELENILKKYSNKKDFIFADLGCGTGKLLFKIASKFPKAKFVGVEVNPFITFYCKFKKFLFRKSNINFVRANIFKIDIAKLKADFIYLYLGEKLSIDISGKLQKQVGKNTYIISNKFELYKLNLVYVVDYNNLINGPLRVYKKRS